MSSDLGRGAQSPALLDRARRAAQGQKRRHRRTEGLRRPRPLRRSRLAAGRCRPHRHLDGLPDAQSGVPVAAQSREPAVRLLDGRRHLARHRLCADGRRDRSVGRLGQRPFLGAFSACCGCGCVWPPALAMLAALAAGCLIGWMYALLFNRLGMPSFVSTLSGLLAFLGLQLYILGPNGSINLPYGSGAGEFRPDCWSCRSRSPTRWPRFPARSRC